MNVKYLSDASSFRRSRVERGPRIISIILVFSPIKVNKNVSLSVLNNRHNHKKQTPPPLFPALTLSIHFPRGAKIRTAESRQGNKGWQQEKKNITRKNYICPAVGLELYTALNPEKNWRMTVSIKLCFQKLSSYIRGYKVTKLPIYQCKRFMLRSVFQMLYFVNVWGLNFLNPRFK